MVILGFMLNYALRVNLTIAIVAMVEETPKTTPNHTLVYETHSTDELSSASHTLHTIDHTPESFQNSTDKVSKEGNQK